MICPHCKSDKGHYGDVAYKCIDNKWYWSYYRFCHICAHKVYTNESEMEEV